MAAAAWATNLTTFWLTGATTVTALGGGAAGLSNPETDFFIEGTDCLSKQAWTNAVKGFIVDALGANFTVPTDGAVILFAKFDAPGSLATKANGGFRVVIGSAATAYYHYYVGGSDTLAFDSWVPYVIDPNTATVDNTTGAPAGTERWVGILANLPTVAGPTKGNPVAIDALRYGRCDVEYTLGDVSPNGPSTFALTEAHANATTRRWGLIQLEGGAYIIQGFHSFGVAGTAVDFRDSNKVLFWRPCGANNLTNDAVSTAFNRMEILNASSIVEWDNIIVQALGTRARGVFVHTAGSLTLTSCQFVDMDTFSFLAAATVTSSVFRRCNAVTAPGTTLTGTKILASTVAADASALVWDVATDPDGLLDNMEFSKGALAHHAIAFGLTSPTTMTLRGLDFSGFNAADAQNDSALHFLRTTGTVTVNLVGVTGTVKVKTAGATVNLVIDPVTTLVHVQDVNTATEIEGARVWLPVTSAVGGYPYLSSITSINRSGATATVVMGAAHGLTTSDYVHIQGATEPEYNGTFQVTVTSATDFTYTVSGTPTTPAGGTKTATFVVLFGTTDVGGDISASKSWAADQPVSGNVRYASGGGPYYKSSPLVGTIDSLGGLTLTAQLIPD